MLLGIDAGGTSTRAVVLDETGQCLGFGVGGGGNPVALGPGAAGRGIRDAVESAYRQARELGHLTEAQASPDGPRDGVSVLAMAGASSFVAPWAMTGQVRDVCPVDRVELVSDLVAMFAAGGPEESGYALVSGTGAAGLRVENSVVTASADGLGWLLGDEGSGFWLGHNGIRAALAAMAGQAPRTAMAALLQQELGVEVDSRRTPRGRMLVLESAIDVFYQMPPIELAKYASLVFRAAGVPEVGDDDEAPAALAPGADPVAAALLTEAVRLLTRTLSAVRVPRLGGPVVLGGSVARRLPGLVPSIRFSFEDEGLPAPRVSMVTDGAVGAAVLTLRAAGVQVDAAMHARVRETMQPLRAR